MELNEAIEHLVQSEKFKAIAKQKDSLGGRYRSFISRYKKGELRTAALIDMLLEHGYKLDIKKPR